MFKKFACILALLMLICLGTSDTAWRDEGQIKSDYKVLGTNVKNMGTEVFPFNYR